MLFLFQDFSLSSQIACMCFSISSESGANV